MGAVEAPSAAAGERLRALRKDRGYSQSELSRRTVTVGDLGVAEITIRSIEGGRRTGSAETFVALARALEVSEDTFPEIKLAAARRLFDERAIGLEKAQANYERFIAAETPAARAMRQAMEDAARGQDPDASAGGASQPR